MVAFSFNKLNIGDIMASLKRKKAGRKAWRTRVRKYGKSGCKRGRRSTKPRRCRRRKVGRSTKRARAARKAWRTRKRKYGKSGTKRRRARKSRRRR